MTAGLRCVRRSHSRRRRHRPPGCPPGRRARSVRQSRRARAPTLPPFGRSRPVVECGGLDGRTGGDELVFGRNADGAPGQVGHDTPVGGAPGGSADEEHASLLRRAAEGIGTREQVADHALHGRSGELGRRHVGAQAGQRAGRVRPVRRPLAVEVGDEHEAARSRRRLERQRVEPGVVDAEQARHRVGHLGGVHGADQRQVAAGGVGEAGDRAGRVGRRFVGDGEGGAARPRLRRGRPDEGRGRARRPCCRPSRRPPCPAPRHSPAMASGASTSGSAASQSTSSLTRRSRSTR